jgi:ATP-dependent Clp protease ATP-binding subunit ClpC
MERGFDPTLGARPLRRAIQRFVEDPLSEILLKKGLKKDAEIQVGVKGDGLDFHVLTETSDTK